MGKNDKNKKKIKGTVKTNLKTDKKLLAKHKKMLEKLGEKDIDEVVAQLEMVEKQRQTVVETIVQPPTPRSNFSICAYPDKDEFIIFGGDYFNGQILTVYNELYFYNISKNEWKLIKSPAGPGPRSSHQMVSVSNDGGQLWLFGGEHASPSQLQFYHYRDLWIYHLNKKQWEKVAVENGPSPRSGHRMITMKKALFVFGGFYDNGVSYKYFNDIWTFSMETYTWQEIKPIGNSPQPQPRSACCMAPTTDGKILIWGGYSRTSVKKEIDRGVTHTDMFALIPEKNDSSTKSMNWKWALIKVGGMRPVPRSSVNCVAAQNGKCYQFGGVLDTKEDEENLDGSFSNELHMLQLSTQVWRLINLSGVSTKEKKSKNKFDKDEEMTTDDIASSTSSTAKTISTDGVFTMVVGGTASNENKNSNKSVMPTSVCIPSPRMKAGLVICKGILYLYGGVCEHGDQQITYSDLYSIDLHKLDTWKRIIENKENEWLGSDSESNSDSDDDHDKDSDDDDDSDDDEESSSGMETD